MNLTHISVTNSTFLVMRNVSHENCIKK